MKPKVPKHYQDVRRRYPHYIEAVEALGMATKESGPIEGTTAQLIQLAAAATIQSEGAVHSHVKRALEAGVKPEEVFHTLILLTSTIGFPKVMAAISWARDIVEENRQGLSE